ncbi:MAG: hypothetical protein FD178_3763, partial [Ignavibacteria bacterium]
MGQTPLSQWWEIIVGILSIPATLFGIITSFNVIQMKALEKQKLKLETRKLELETRKLEIEILEKEKKPRSKPKFSEKTVSDNKLRTALEKFLTDIQSGENSITNLLMKLMSPFKVYRQKESTVSINRQRVTGSLVELVFLLLFLYTDLNQSANTFAYVFGTPVPPFLTNLLIPLVISSAGTSMVLGLIMGDLLGITNLTSWADLRESRKPFLPIILGTLILSVVLSALLSLNRLGIMQNSLPFISLISSLADSFFIIPTLITTSFLFNGIQGILVLLALPILLLRLPVTIFRKIVARFVY